MLKIVTILVHLVGKVFWFLTHGVIRNSNLSVTQSLIMACKINPWMFDDPIG